MVGCQKEGKQLIAEFLEFVGNCGFGGGVAVSLPPFEFRDHSKHILFQRDQRRAGRLDIDVMDVPVADAFGPIGKSLRHQGTVLGFLEANDEGGVEKVRQLQAGGLPSGEGEGNIPQFERGPRLVGQILGRKVGMESPRLGAPGQSTMDGVKIEQRLGKPASVEIAGTHEHYRVGRLHPREVPAVVHENHLRIVKFSTQYKNSPFF